MKNKITQNESQNWGVPYDSAHPSFFEIRVRGHLDESWSDWLDGLEMKLIDNGEMILFGHIGDQAALMGILNKLHNLNLTLLSVSNNSQKK